MNVNCPLLKGSGDAEVLHLWDRILLPILEQYRPELLLVSAGFDAHRSDPIGELRMTDRGFEQLTARIEAAARRFEIPAIYTLEGGYHPAVVRDGIRAALKSHVEPFTPSPPPPSTPLAEELTRKAAATFAPFWKF
jgi:acetoin utilization deacetylase AcuC-like enzyme